MRAPKHQPFPGRVARHTPREAIRETSAQRGYGSRWQKARMTFLARSPLCVECEAAGRVAAATVVDHITPHKGDQALFWDSGNWQSMCGPCHNRKTATEDGGFGNFHRSKNATNG